MSEDVIRVIRIEDVMEIFPNVSELEANQLWAVIGDHATELYIGPIMDLDHNSPRCVNRWECKHNLFYTDEQVEACEAKHYFVWSWADTPQHEEDPPENYRPAAGGGMIFCDTCGASGPVQTRSEWHKPNCLR